MMASTIEIVNDTPQIEVGTDYQASTLREWDNGERVDIAAKEIICEWLNIKHELKKSSSKYNGQLDLNG